MSPVQPQQNHTTGPWQIEYDPLSGNTYVIGDLTANPPVYVATIETAPLRKAYAAPEDSAGANASLIAQAWLIPELVDALEELVDAHDQEPSMLTAEEWAKARAVLARAPLDCFGSPSNAQPAG